LAKVDVDAEPALSHKYGIMSMPTCFATKSRREIRRRSVRACRALFLGAKRCDAPGAACSGVGTGRGAIAWNGAV